MEWVRKITSVVRMYLCPEEKRPVRKMFPVLIGFLAFLGASALTSVDSSYIKLTPSQSMVMSGEAFYIEVFAYAHVPVNALDITIEFDEASLEILSVDKGQSVLTLWTEEPAVEGNRITLTGGTYRRGFVGEHLVATVKAKAKGSGKADFKVSDAILLAGDGSGKPVSLTHSATESEKSFVIYNQNEDPTTLEATLNVGISADIDGDGTVTLKDISTFMSAWYNGDTRYDFNNDAKMNFIDFSIILARSFFRSAN